MILLRMAMFSMTNSNTSYSNYAESEPYHVSHGYCHLNIEQDRYSHDCVSKVKIDKMRFLGAFKIYNTRDYLAPWDVNNRDCKRKSNGRS